MSQTEQMQEWIDHHSKRADRAEAINAELLKALREFVDVCEPRNDDEAYTMAHALDAIAKATGGAQ